MSRYRLAAYHLAQAISCLLSSQDLRSKVKDEHRSLSRAQLRTMSAEEIAEFFGETLGGRLSKTVVL